MLHGPLIECQLAKSLFSGKKKTNKTKPWKWLVPLYTRLHTQGCAPEPPASGIRSCWVTAGHTHGPAPLGALEEAAELGGRLPFLALSALRGGPAARTPNVTLWKFISKDIDFLSRGFLYLPHLLCLSWAFAPSFSLPSDFLTGSQRTVTHHARNT